MAAPPSYRQALLQYKFLWAALLLDILIWAFLPTLSYHNFYFTEIKTRKRKMHESYGESRTTMVLREGFFCFSSGGDGATNVEKQGGQFRMGSFVVINMIVNFVSYYLYTFIIHTSLELLFLTIIEIIKLNNLPSAKSRRKLFEKVLTPSDVGKLNRLVIPKRHAEKHFPLGTGNILKRVLLSFEDAQSKLWWFQYSYWSSSQSYVLTKGWSRFVREKNLRAGNVVSFKQSNGPDKLLYIDCRKGRNDERDAAAEAIGVSDGVRTVRLFGVDISEVLPRNDGDFAIDGSGPLQPYKDGRNGALRV